MPEASNRQRKQLKRWAKGKSIKAREIQEFIVLGWIEYESGMAVGGVEGIGYAARPVISDSGREVIGRNTQTIFDA